MDKFIISGGNPIIGSVTLSGAKNVALKALVASLLTDEDVILHNIPEIRDVLYLLEALKTLGVSAVRDGHTVRLRYGSGGATQLPLEVGARLRTSFLVLGPLLARYGKASIPNPGGCRIGARPIDRHIDGLKKMGASLRYDSADGFFHAEAMNLTGAEITFTKNTHTGTEALILAAVLARGTTILKNAAQEIEIDNLIEMLVAMGAKIKRTKPREIMIEGVEKMHGVEFTIMPDRNEEVTFAVAAAITNGSITVTESVSESIASFISLFEKAGGGVERRKDRTTRYFVSRPLTATDVVTGIYPGFMTDWQAPWAVLMTQANGVSTIHETVFENRFSYVKELKKMGAAISFYKPEVKDPEVFYNFNLDDMNGGMGQAIEITGPTKLHNAVVTIDDLRAGATLVLAALAASGESYIHGVEQVDRGYESFETRLRSMGASIERVKEVV